MAALPLISLFLIIFTTFAVSATTTQSPPSSSIPAPSPSPAVDICNGVLITYTYRTGRLLPPVKLSTAEQAYRFESDLTVLNNGDEELKSWKVFVGFRHDEYLVSATDAVLADGTSLPARVGNGTVFAGSPQMDLKTAVQTAGDVEQMSAKVEMVGTEFGVSPVEIPMPSNVSLVNDGFLCPEPSMKDNRTMVLCCTRDPNAKPTITLDDKYLPRQKGDLTIMYDVTKTYDQNYWAQVTLTNHNPLGRLDYWKLSWDWMRNEFIFAMKGAYPAVADTNDCVFGPQAQAYSTLDFSTALNCYRRPTIVDLPATKADDPTLGKIPFCCRNGTILPPSMNESQSVSSFLINVYKMPQDFNKSVLYPPQNWKIKGTLNPEYECGQPIKVSPSSFQSTDGLSTNSTAVASWQVVCNITKPKNSNPKCCVSFSTYFNASVVPCKTCACGCSSSNSRTCSTKSPALLIPPEAQLLPFENRTKLTLAWASLKHHMVPNPLPCGDNCGVSINWHLYTDYAKGWSARITIFNWQETAFPDWFVAVEMDKAAPGFEKAYSFNGSLMTDADNTIFMQGLPGLNYIMGVTNGTNPDKNPRVPGKQQSVLSFTKKSTPGILVEKGDGFPSKVFFNGEECSLPSNLPTAGGQRHSPVGLVLCIFLVLGALFVGL